MKPALRLMAAMALACLFAAPLPAEAAAQAGTLTADQAAQDARILQRTLKALHPALTKYRTQAQMDTAFAHFDSRAKAARTASEMYLAASELAASIRCGHTWTNVLNQEGAIKAALLDSANKLPLRITLVGGRWLVLSSADPAVASGDEILAIDGVAGKDVVARMLPYLRADGSSDGKRLRQLSHDRNDFNQMDIVWPLLSPPKDGEYSLQVRGARGLARSVRVKAMTLSQRDALLQAKGVKLPNEGGDGAIGGEVLSHLVKQPFDFLSTQSTSAYERVPYELARYLDTWDYSFFDRTGKVERITSGTAAGKYRYTDAGDGKQTIVPVKTPYTGRTYILVEPSLDAVRAGRDLEMENVQRLIGSRR